MGDQIRETKRRSSGARLPGSILGRNQPQESSPIEVGCEIIEDCEIEMAPREADVELAELIGDIERAPRDGACRSARL